MSPTSFVRPRLAIAALSIASAIASAAAAQAQTPPPPPVAAAPVPRSEVGPRRSEDHVTIDGSMIRVRPSSDGFNDVTLPLTAARLFEVLPNAFGDVGLTLKEFDDKLQQSGTGTFRAQFRIGKERLSTFLDCGLDPMGLRKADSYAMSMRVTTQIVPESAERGTVRTLVQATGRAPSNSSLTVHCPSTGALEQRIVDAIVARASAR